eukprot:TRINITY_DN22994_c0_g1_i1.p1 TRINITY_DN22994_c0_g1~~TRINITY_DN22994_c0_g1_i1.p1  ORF type:complete len:856 (+),score=158.36 TRINITY_DN22994_c0_g1_i1:140-2707(+)
MHQFDALARWLSWPQLSDANCWPPECHPVTLRLSTPALEALFIHTRAAALSSRFFAAAALVLVVCVELLLDSGQRRQQCAQPGGTDAVVLAELTGKQQAVVGTTAVSSLLVMLLLRSPSRLFEGFDFVSCELGAACAAVGLTLALCYADFYNMARRSGHDPVALCRSDSPTSNAASGGQSSLPPFADSQLLLALAGVDLGVCWLLPIRFCVACAVSLMGVLCYSFMLLVAGSPEGGRAGAGNLALLAMLNGMCLAGKWRAECNERVLFLSGKCRRSAREDGSFSFEMEAPILDLADSGDHDNGPTDYGAGEVPGDFGDDGERVDMDACSSVPSVPTTTHTGRVFAELERVDVEPRWKLERIAAIGIKEHWLIHSSDIRIQPNRILGSGSFGVVVLANLHGSQVAVKVPRSSNGATAWHLPSIGNELRVLRHVRHPNVVLFHGACIDPASSELALVLEYVNGRVLDKYLETMPSDTDRHGILIDVCCALRYLHGQRPSVVHGDLKTSNILVEDRRNRPLCKLVDFGLSRLLTRKAKPLGGTLTWMAPELLKQPGMPPAPSADVFSFGRLTYYVITGGHALSGVDARTLVKLARQSKMPPLVWSDSESVPFCRECRELVEKCVQFDARSRPPMVSVFGELVSWQLRGDASDTSGCSDVAESQGECWSEGLRILRELLRPVPPNRAQAPNGGDGGGRDAGSDSGGAGTPPGGAGAGSPLGVNGMMAPDGSDALHGTDGLRQGRPLPPPRSPAAESLRTRKRELPVLPPVEEVTNGEAFSSFAKSMSAPGNLSEMPFMPLFQMLDAPEAGDLELDLPYPDPALDVALPATAETHCGSDAGHTRLEPPPRSPIGTDKLGA